MAGVVVAAVAVYFMSVRGDAGVPVIGLRTVACEEAGGEGGPGLNLSGFRPAPE